MIFAGNSGGDFTTGWGKKLGNRCAFTLTRMCSGKAKETKATPLFSVPRLTMDDALLVSRFEGGGDPR